jgi:hypothetical protein
VGLRKAEKLRMENEMDRHQTDVKIKEGKAKIDAELNKVQSKLRIDIELEKIRADAKIKEEKARIDAELEQRIQKIKSEFKSGSQPESDSDQSSQKI